MSDGTPAGVAIAEVLADAGITHVFGVPGGYSIKVFDGLRTVADRVQSVRAAHEHQASVMADMYGRLTGRPGVFTGQGPFAASSGGFGLMEGFLSGTPMLVLTEMTDHGIPQHAPTQGTTGDHGSVDLPRILSGMTKFMSVATTPNEAVHAVELAIHHATSGRPGPAAVVFRLDAIFRRTDKARHPRLYGRNRVASAAPPRPTASAVSALADLLAKAKRPVIVAGNGIHQAQAYDQLDALARRAAAPVVTTAKARGVIADDHPWAGGPLSPFGWQGAFELLARADAVVVLGSRLNPHDTLVESPTWLDADRQRIAQVDIEAANLGVSFPVELGVHAELGALLGELVPAVGVDENLASDRWADLAEIKSRAEDPPVLHESASPVPPQRVMQVLNEVWPADGRLTLDAGNNRIFAYHYLEARTPGRLHLPGGHLGMGWGPPAALAAAMVHPGERVLSISGDGGFLMSLHNLATAVEYGLPVTFLVLNNRMLGNVYDFQGPDRRTAVDIGDHDFAAVARAFGMAGRRVDDDAALADALASSLATDGPALIEVSTDPDHSSDLVRVRDSHSDPS